VFFFPDYLAKFTWIATPSSPLRTVPDKTKLGVIPRTWLVWNEGIQHQTMSSKNLSKPINEDYPDSESAVDVHRL
jgi:hypothetical protein